MEAEPDVTTLSQSELVALVYDLRRQLATRDEEIARLKQQDAKNLPQSATDVPNTAGDSTQPGTQEDLISQLEKTYPE